jgi:hypothetical protein
LGIRVDDASLYDRGKNGSRQSCRLNQTELRGANQQGKQTCTHKTFSH